MNLKTTKIKIMKKSNLIIQSLMVMTAFFMVSCNNDDGINCPADLTGELNATETQFSGTWEFSGMMAEDAIDISDDKIDNPNKNIYEQYTPCARDLVYNFMTDRKYSLKLGSLAADCTDKQELTGTWRLEDGKALSFVANCSSQTSQITLDETGKTFSYVTTLTVRDVTGFDKATKVTFTYTKVEVVETPQ